MKEGGVGSMEEGGSGIGVREEVVEGDEGAYWEGNEVRKRERE